MNGPTLDQQDRLLLEGFAQPGGSALRWDTTVNDWSIGNPMFSISDPLLRRVDRLLDAGLIRFADTVTACGLCDVVLTDIGRQALR